MERRQNAVGDYTCQYWDPTGCEGTPACPARCPRFVDDYGAAFTIRPLQEDETGKLLDCYLSRPEADEIHRQDEREHIEFDPTGRTERGEDLVVVPGERILGHARIDPGSEYEAQCVVRAEARGRGITAELVRQVLARASTDDAERVVLSSAGDVGDDLARRLGFEPTERGYELELPSPRAGRATEAPAMRYSDGVVPREPVGSPTVEGLFDPDRVAVVGASERSGSLGRVVLSNLVEGFDGEVVPIHPTADSVLGLEAYSDIRDVPGTVDLAVVAVAAEDAIEAVAAAGEAGVDHGVVIAGGFGEAGPEGRLRERTLREVAGRHDLTLVGPNCLGILATRPGLNASFAPSMPPRGRISFITQSGAFVTSLLQWVTDEGLGVNHVVSLGNGAVVDEVDLLRYWDRDPGTDVVVAYLEGVERGREFARVARSVTRSTPVVLLDGGRTQEGGDAAASHTGALAGRTDVSTAVMDQAGVVRVESVEELFDVARILVDQPLPDGDSVGAVTNAGGPGVMATDALSDEGLSLSSLSEETQRLLSESLPEAASVANPVDVLGDADVDRFEEAIDAVLSDPTVDAGVVLTTPHPLIDYPDLARAVVEARETHGKPVVACLMDPTVGNQARQLLRENGVPNYFDPARAARSLRALVEYADTRGRTVAPPPAIGADVERARDVIQSAVQAGRNSLGPEALELLEAYGIDTPDADVVDSPAAAEAVAHRIGGEVAMKVVSPDVAHKTDLGGVETGVRPPEARTAYRRIIESVEAARPEAAVDGVLVQEQVPTEPGVETMVGATRETAFGPTVTVGLGGTFVEVLEDVSFAVPPLAREDVEVKRQNPDTWILRTIRP